MRTRLAIAFTAEAAIAACMPYVDLHPIRAGIVESRRPVASHASRSASTNCSRQKQRWQKKRNRRLISVRSRRTSHCNAQSLQLLADTEPNAWNMFRKLAVLLRCNWNRTQMHSAEAHRSQSIRPRLPADFAGRRSDASRMDRPSGGARQTRQYPGPHPAFAQATGPVHGTPTAIIDCRALTPAQS